MNLSEIPDGTIYHFRVFTYLVVFFCPLSRDGVKFVAKILN